MDEMKEPTYKPKEVYLNNPDDVRLAHFMYENNIDLALLEERL